MNYSISEKIIAIKKITRFNSFITYQILNNKRKFDSKLINDLKNECKKIDDLYNFNYEVDNISFIKQIQHFCNCTPK